MKRIALSMLLLVAAFAGLWAGGVSPAGGQDERKVIVCKYIGTPGVDERLQTGDNPISVSANALEGRGFTGVFPFEFSDAQGRSVAVRFAVGNERGSLSDCPGVTTSSTTTTTPTTTGTPRETFFAGTICDLANSRYVVSGEVDGQPATVIPQFIPGDKAGTSLVIVTLGSFTGVATVNTAGTCVSTGTTTAPPGSTTSPGGGGSGGGGTTTGTQTGATSTGSGTTTGIAPPTNGTSTGTSTGISTITSTPLPKPVGGGTATSTTFNGTTPRPNGKPKTTGPSKTNRPNGSSCPLPNGEQGAAFAGRCHPVIAGNG